MNKTLPRQLLACCSAILLTASTGVCQRIYLYNYQNDPISGIDGRIFANSGIGSGNGRLHAITFGFGSMSTPIDSWNTGDKTTVIIGAPLGAFQRGANGKSNYGATAVAIQDSGVSCWHNTDSLTRGLVSTGQSECQVKVNFEKIDKNIPFLNPGKGLAMGFYLKVPSVLQGSAPSYFSIGLRFVDKITGAGLSVGNYIYDSRNKWSEAIGWDNPMQTGYARTYIGSSTKLYFSDTQGTRHGGAATWSEWEYYQFNFKSQNLLNAINGINNKYLVGLSTDLTRYRLSYVVCANVIHWPNDGTNLNGKMASAVKELKVWLFDAAN